MNKRFDELLSFWIHVLKVAVVVDVVDVLQNCSTPIDCCRLAALYVR